MIYQKEYLETKSKLLTSNVKLKQMETELVILKNQIPYRISEIEVLENERKIQKEIVENNKVQLRKIESAIACLAIEPEDLELTVFHYRFIKGYTHTKIAKKLHYSVARIKQITRQIREKLGDETHE